MTRPPLLDIFVGLGVLFAFTALGEGTVHALNAPLPGSVVGMLLLWLALSARVIRLEWVERAADSLLGVLGLLFVPAGVGIMTYLDAWRMWPVWFGIGALGVIAGSLVASLLTSRLERS